MPELSTATINDLSESGPKRGSRRRWLIWALVAFTVVISLIKLPASWPDVMGYMQPFWLLLVTLYWSINIPRSVGLLLPWLAGLILDISTNALLGQHALALVMTCFLAQKSYLQLRSVGWLLQSVAIMVFAIIYEIQILWIDLLIERETFNPWRWLPLATTVILWTPVFALQRHIQQRLGIR